MARRPASSDANPLADAVADKAISPTPNVDGTIAPAKPKRTTKPKPETVSVENTGDVSSKPVTAPRPRRVKPASVPAPEETIVTPATAVQVEVKLPQPEPAKRRSRTRVASAGIAADSEMVDTSSASVEVLDTAKPPARQRSRGGQRVSSTNPSAQGAPDAELGAGSDTSESQSSGVSVSVSNQEAEGNSLSEPSFAGGNRNRRSRGRRGQGGDSENREARSTVAQAAETEVTEDPENPGRGSRNRRSRNRRGRPGDTDTANTSSTTGVTSAEGEVSTEEGDDRRRARGLRRTRTVAAPQLMLDGAVEVNVDSPSDDSASQSRRSSRSSNLPPPIPLLVPIPEEPLPPVFAPLQVDMLARLSKTDLRVVNGRPVLHINGTPHPAIMFFVNTEGDFDRVTAQRQIRYAYQAGVRIFTVLAHLPWRTSAGERIYTHLDDMLQCITEVAPDVMLLPRIIFSPPSGWVRRNPEDMAVGIDGPTGDVSLGSQVFWSGDAEEALRASLTHLAEGPYADRILGIYLEHGEWIYDRIAGFDRSPANTKAFRRWLRSEYRGNVVQLRASWHDGNVTFDNAEVPSYPHPTSFPAGANQFFGARERRWVDFHAFSSKIVASVINRLARVVKETTADKLTVAVSYGYTFELPRGHSGHLALADVLMSPYVDMLTGPFSYTGREAGGSAPFPCPVDSIHLHGKLWIAEDDTKTYLASGESPDTYNVKLDNLGQTQTVHARNFGAALAKGTGISWMDLWGEGWLDSEEIWESLAALVEVAKVHLDRQLSRQTPIPQPTVAVFVDETSCFSVRDEALMSLLISDHRDTFARAGVDIGYYLLSDLCSDRFVHTVKMAVILNAFTLSEPVKGSIRTKLNNHGTTVIWMMGPGCLDGGVSELADVVGLHLKLQPYASKAGATFQNHVNTMLLDGINGMQVGNSVRRHPLIAVDDFRARVLAEFPNRAGAVGIRKHPRHQSMFIGEPVLSPGLFRNLCRLAGVHRYQADDDVVWVSDNWLAVHSGPGGGIKVVIPQPSGIYDVVFGEVITTQGYGRDLAIPERGTRLLVIGNTDVQLDFGADASGIVDGFAQDILPDFIPFEFEAEDVPPVVDPAPEEDLLAKAIAEMPLHKMEPKAADIELDPNTGEVTRRRRRRRRGEPEPDIGSEVVTRTDALGSTSKTLPPLDELLPQSSQVLTSSSSSPDDSQGMDDNVEASKPVKRRRPPVRRPRKTADADVSTEGAGGDGSPPPVDTN